MTDQNRAIWDRFADIDPQFTKPITGKPYKGTSPSPQYVIRCLTDLFGPVGSGFGWDVVAEDFTPMGDEMLHWCRIKFWHTDRANTFDAYGQTKALMKTRNGLMLDEDAPKKSLTDAIVKAASQIGIGANIFLGRWDDSKYVAEVNAEYRKAEAPPFDPAAAEARIISAVNKTANGRELSALWRAEEATIEQIGGEGKDRIMAAFSKRKTQLTENKEAA